MWNNSLILGMGLYIWPGAEDWSGGRGQRITLKNDFSCIWQVGTSCRWRKAILQYQKGTFPIVPIACCWRHALTSPAPWHENKGSSAQKHGSLTHPGTSDHFFVSAWGAGDTRIVVQCPDSQRTTPFPARGWLWWRSWDSRSGACLCLQERG